MEYASQKDRLVIKEYGRHVHDLIRYAISLEDRNERNEFAKGLVKLIAQISPNTKNQDDYERKLWDHLFLMSDFKLDVDSPYPKPEKPEDVLPKPPDRLPYPGSKIKYRHYGKNVESLVAKAVNMDDKDKQVEFAKCIGNYMKLVYNTWNRDNVNDQIIKTDLELLSDNVLQIPEDANLDTLARSQRKRPFTGRQGGRSKSKRGGGRNSGRNYHRKYRKN